LKNLPSDREMEENQPASEKNGLFDGAYLMLACINYQVAFRAEDRLREKAVNR
jgi:hypothetical protein